jgi:uncharacterized membrane protein YjfL (UPF0719 family)
MLFDQLITGLVYLAVTFVLLVVGKLVYRLVHRRFSLREELFERDNVALAFAMTGYYLGLVFSLTGVLIGPSAGLINDLIDLLIYGSLAIVLLNLSIFINDRIILHSFSNEKEILTDQNAGTGVIEGANSVAVGLIVAGALSGQGSLLTALVFWLVGQLALILAGLVYERVLPYDLHVEVERDNVAVGVAFAGLLIGLGNLTRVAIAGDFVSWSLSLGTAVLYIVTGLVLFPMIRWLTDLLLVPGVTLEQELVQQEKPNVGAGLIEAFAYVAASLLIGGTI